MPQLTHAQYDILERAVARGERVAVSRRGTEYIVTPLALRISGGRELIETRNPTTGDDLTLFLDELDSVQAVPR